MPDQAGSQQRAWEQNYLRHGRLWRGGKALDFEVPSGARILELGCGDGKTLASLISQAHPGSWIVGLDHSPTALRLCRQLEVDSLPSGATSVDTRRAALMVGDVRNLPFHRSSFDMLICHHLLEHLWSEDTEPVIQQLGKVLKVGGELMVRVFSTGDFRSGRGEEVEPGTFKRGSEIICHYFEEAELQRLVVGSGLFDLVQCGHEQRIVRYEGQEDKRDVLLAQFRRRDR